MHEEPEGEGRGGGGHEGDGREGGGRDGHDGSGHDGGGLDGVGRDDDHVVAVAAVAACGARRRHAVSKSGG